MKRILLAGICAAAALHSTEVQADEEYNSCHVEELTPRAFIECHRAQYALEQELAEEEERVRAKQAAQEQGVQAAEAAVQSPQSVSDEQAARFWRVLAVELEAKMFATDPSQLSEGQPFMRGFAFRPPDGIEVTELEGGYIALHWASEPTEECDSAKEAHATSEQAPQRVIITNTETGEVQSSAPDEAPAAGANSDSAPEEASAD